MFGFIPPTILRSMNKDDVKRVVFTFKKGNDGSDVVQLMVYYELVDIHGNVSEANKRLVTEIGAGSFYSAAERLRDGFVLDELMEKEGFI